MVKRVLNYVLLLGAALLVTSCELLEDKDLKNDVRGLEDRVSQLEKRCEQINADIAALQGLIAAMQQNDYITDVAPVSRGGETIGYTISFAQRAPITIYSAREQSGEQGGEQGPAGHVPAIGVRQDADGVYCWTLDGEWLTDDYGNRIAAQGKDGADGQDGINGSDGITPEFRITDGYWEISYDGGDEWERLGKATGENGADGTDGTDGSNGGLIGIVQDDRYVHFNLADGTTIDLLKLTEVKIDFDVQNSDSDKGVVFRNIENFETLSHQKVNYAVETSSASRITVKVELLNDDGTYKIHSTVPKKTEKGVEGSIDVVPVSAYNSDNQIIVTVSDGDRTVMSGIDLSIEPGLTGNTLIIKEPGTLSTLIDEKAMASVEELKIYGYMNNVDIDTINKMGNLTSLDMENVHMTDDEIAGYFGCNSLLHEIRLPLNLKTIGDHTFENCTQLKQPVLPGTLESIGYAAFKNCTGLSDQLILPNGLKSIGASAFENCGFTGSLTIPEGIETIEENTFRNCSKFSSLKLPKSLKTIGNYAFMRCSRIQGVTFSAGLTDIGMLAFSGCNSIGELTLPLTLEKLGIEAFSECKGLNKVKICGDNLKTIPTSAFKSCTSIKYLAILANVETIESEAFADCINPGGEIYLPSTLKRIKTLAFFTNTNYRKEAGDSVAKIYCLAKEPPTIDNNVWSQQARHWMELHVYPEYRETYIHSTWVSYWDESIILDM